MVQILNVYALPTLVTSADLAGGAAVVIDVLRATTSMVYLLEAGAKGIIPCQEIDEARQQAAQLPAGEVLLAGERHALPIDGFDLVNSPSQCTPQRVAGKTIVLTTTNGTRAVLAARHARRVLIGAFVNVTAVYEQLLMEDQVHLICSGTDGHYSQDDVLLAGLLVERLVRSRGLPCQLNAQALTARETWLAAFPVPMALGGEPLEPQRLARELQKSPGGQRLTQLGLVQDVLDAACIDRFRSVPELLPGQGVIRLHGGLS
jgi:2-phosphosulfolactate phosphatase